MHIRDLVRLACVVLGLTALLNAFGLLQAIATIPFYVGEIVGNPVGYGVVLGVAAAILVAGGVLLLVRRDRIAAALFREPEPQESLLAASDVEDLAYSVLGLYLAITTLPDLGSLAGALVNLRAMESTENFGDAFRNTLPHYIGTLLQLLTGGFLVLYANHVGSFLRRRRGVASAQPPSPAFSRCPNCDEPYDPDQYRPDAPTWLCSRCGQALARDKDAEP